jgi:hypothetical protein
VEGWKSLFLYDMSSYSFTISDHTFRVLKAHFNAIIPVLLFQARPLLTVELRDPELSCLIAQKMAQIHALNIPISKEPCWLWGTMDR